MYSEKRIIFHVTYSIKQSCNKRLMQKYNKRKSLKQFVHFEP